MALFSMGQREGKRGRNSRKEKKGRRKQEKGRGGECVVSMQEMTVESCTRLDDNGNGIQFLNLLIHAAVTWKK